MKQNSDLLFRHICREDIYLFNYTQLPDELFTIDVFTGLSLHAKVLYSFMLRRVSISKNNNWIDESGDVYIYYRTDEIMEKFNCSNKTASKIMAELEEIGLIEKKRQGQGKPDIIYVNKFSTVTAQDEELPEPHNEEDMDLILDENMDRQNVPNSEVKKLHFQKCKKYTSGNVKNTSLEVKNLHPNYKENNNKDLIKSASSPNTVSSPVFHAMEHVRLMEEDEEAYKAKFNYHEAERLYTAQIAAAAFTELMKRDHAYLSNFTAEMFLRVCKSIVSSKEPVVYLPGLLNWCYDHINFSPPENNNKNGHPAEQFHTFMHQEYDFDEIEKNFLANK